MLNFTAKKIDLSFEDNIMKSVYTHELISSLSENTANPKIEFRRVLNKDDEVREQMICENCIVIENLCVSELFFDSIDFNGGISLRNSKIKKLTFYSCNFRRNIDDHVLNTFNLNIETLEFKDCSFDGLVYIGSFNGMVKSIDFHSCRINNNVLFDTIKLAHDGKISIGADNVYIKGDCEFRKCTIVKGTIDIRANIEGELRFYLINKAYSDENSQLNKPYHSCLEFHAVNIRKIRFYESNIHSVSMHNTAVEDIYQQNTIIERLQSEALNSFRDAAIKNNDDVLTLKYTGDLYDRILKERIVFNLRAAANKLFPDQSVANKAKIKFSRVIYKILEPLLLLICSLGSGERIMLWFNKYSNDFNRSWIRGVCFTMIVTLIFYFILNYCGMQSPYFIIDFRFEGFDKVLLGYINMIDITCWKDSENIFNLTPIGGVIMFFAKLFIVYGVWQTIYAFYKYKK